MKNTIAKIYVAWNELEYELSIVSQGKRGWKAAAARARKKSFELEKLMKEFRKASCAEANETE